MFYPTVFLTHERMEQTGAASFFIHRETVNFPSFRAKVSFRETLVKLLTYPFVISVMPSMTPLSPGPGWGFPPPVADVQMFKVWDVVLVSSQRAEWRRRASPLFTNRQF